MSDHDEALEVLNEAENDFDPKKYAIVDPEVRAYVYSLCSALGGTSADDNGRYILGDDALAVLKDIRKWLKLYDQKTNRLDVARCLAEANLVQGDLLEILASWPEEQKEDRLRSKIALACLELLVPLSWPLDKHDAQMTVNHHRHVPYLQLAQLEYKRAVLQHDALTLRKAVRVGLPSMALDATERGTGDDGIVKLLLYFFRNIAMITPPPNLPAEGNVNEVSRSAAIEAFHHQDVLALLLTIASNINDEFKTQDTVILEVLFHLLKGVDVEKLFMDKEQKAAGSTDELSALMKKEAGMHRSYAKTAPTRHNRFGTMIWVKRDDNRMSTVSGQDILKGNQQTLSKMDQTKKWNRPRRAAKDVDQNFDRFDLPVRLSDEATTHLRSFVEEFLDSGFNPLFNSIRRAIEREADRILDSHLQQFFYLISWFLEAERVRRKKKQAEDRKKKTADVFDADSFGLVASVLNQETFVLLSRFMQDRLDMKGWRELHAGMRCFTQTLLIVQEMAQSPLEDDQEIAENIQNRIFYEETTHDRIIAILRGYKDQGFGYLDACTEVAHVFLRMLEQYSKQNTSLHVRSKRRSRKRKKAAERQNGEVNADQAQYDASEEEDRAEIEKVSRERKFDFSRFCVKFMTQPCIDTFVAFTRYYHDLSAEQLKRAHRFFYRVAFKQEVSVMLFRVDIIALFNKMIKGPDGLDRGHAMFREWDELVRQVLKKMLKKLEERPELYIEMLFSKIRSSVYFLEHGKEEESPSSRPRPPAVLEVKGAMTRDEQLGVAVAVLLKNEKVEHIDWVVRLITNAANERQSWEAETEARRIQQEAFGDQAPSDYEVPKPPSITVIPDTDERRLAMFKDNKLRLLLTLAGAERLGLDDELGASWVVPSNITAGELHHTVAVIEGHRENPVFEYGDEDPVSVEEMLRRKPTVRQRAAYDDDDGLASSGDDFVVPALVGPTNKKDALAELKKKRRRRRKSLASDKDTSDGGVISDGTREERRKARLAREREKYMKVKSTDFVRESDEETDEEADREFFRREEERRKGQAGKVLEGMRAGLVKKPKKRKRQDKGEKVEKRRKSPGPDSFIDNRDVLDESDEEDFFARPQNNGGMNGPKKISIESLSAMSNSDDEADIGIDGNSATEENPSSSPQRHELADTNDEATDTPISSQPVAQDADADAEAAADNDEEEPGATVLPQRQKAKAGHTKDRPMSLDSDDDVDFPISGDRNRRRIAIYDSDDD